MKRKRKKVIRYVLTFVLLLSYFTDISYIRAVTGDTTSGSLIKVAQDTGTAENSNGIKQPFEVKKFLTLYRDNLLHCDGNDVKYDTETEDGSLLVTAKNDNMARTSFQFTQAFDFGTKNIDRIQVNALAKRATKTCLELYLDNETECFAAIRLYNQTKEDVWNRRKIYSFDLSSLSKKLTGKHQIRFQLIDNTTASDKKTSILLRSIQFVPESIPVVSLNLDEELGSITAMNSDPEHNTECYGEMSIRIPDRYSCEFGDAQSLKETENTYELDYIRGRGNSTWGPDKKPYKIKLSKKANLFGMGANKHWVLLANYYDNSLLRNRITYYLGRELNMEYTPDCLSVDVVMNHEYLGNYLLCEHVRLDENRVDENDLEDEKYTGTNITGGYLLSMSPYNDDEHTFATTRNSYLVESPQKGNHEKNGLEYIQDYMQKTEDAIYGSDFSLPDGTSYRDLMDVPSAIAYYWIQEFSMNGDAFISNSTYLYKKQDKNGVPGKLYWGPLWDFDYVAWSSYDYSNSPESYINYVNQRTWFTRLIEDPSFAKELKAYWPVLKKALNQVIEKGGILDQYRDEIALSANSNFDTWGYTDFYEDPDANKVKLDFEQEIERLRTWIINRMNWVDQNLEAVTPSEIHLTFMVDGQVYAERTTYSGRPLSNFPEAPTSDNPERVFGGWLYTVHYTDPDSGEERSEEVPLLAEDFLNEDTVLTAQWIPKEEYKEIENIYFEQSEIYLYEGQWLNLKYAIAPFDAMNPSLTFEVSDSSVVRREFDESWVAGDPGTTTITATASNGVKASCKVHVISEREMSENESRYILNSFELDKKEVTLKTGEWQKLDILTDPEEALYLSYLRWISVNPNVATVSEGVICAKQPGTTVILLYHPDTETISSCTVTVEDSDKPDHPAASDTPQPTASPQATKSPKPSASPSTLTGKRFSVGNLNYKVTASQGNKHSVTVTGSRKKSLRSISIPSTIKYKNKLFKVTKIGADAFAGQKKLEKLTIGNHISMVGSGAFRNCRKLKTIVIQSAKLQFVGKRAFIKIHKKACYHVPANKKRDYRKFFGKRVK